MSTTDGAIRDRIVTVIEGLTPTVLAGEIFRAYRNEGDGDFEAWAEEFPNAARRRFQVRVVGDDQPAEVTNLDVELRSATIVLTVAYPQTGRDGKDQALERDDTVAADAQQIEDAIGPRGKANFSAPYAAATIFYPDWQRDSGSSCDFLVMTFAVTFYRAMT